MTTLFYLLKNHTKEEALRLLKQLNTKEQAKQRKTLKYWGL